MNENYYHDTYRATIPKIIDYGCIVLAVLSPFICGFLCLNLHIDPLINNINLLPVLCLCLPFIIGAIPFILHRIPGKICCNEDTVIIADLYHGKNIISIKDIQEIEVKVFAHEEGHIGFMAVHHYIFVLIIKTNARKYKFKMDAKKDFVENYKGDISKKYGNIAFVKLKRYIEATNYINSL